MRWALKGHCGHADVTDLRGMRPRPMIAPQSLATKSSDELLYRMLLNLENGGQDVHFKLRKLQVLILCVQLLQVSLPLWPIHESNPTFHIQTTTDDWSLGFCHRCSFEAHCRILSARIQPVILRDRSLPPDLRD